MLQPTTPAISLYEPRGDDSLFDVLAGCGDPLARGVSAGPASYQNCTLMQIRSKFVFLTVEFHLHSFFSITACPHVFQDSSSC